MSQSFCCKSWFLFQDNTLFEELSFQLLNLEKRHFPKELFERDRFWSRVPSSKASNLKERHWRAHKEHNLRSEDATFAMFI